MILVHVSMAYLPYKEFVYVPSNSNDEIANMIFFLVIGFSYIMHAFFFISGYFFPVSYDRNGGLHFLKKKLLRLGVPLLIVWGYKPLFLDCLWFYHLWYLAVLLCLSFLYLAVRQVFRLEKKVLDSFPLFFTLGCLAFVMGLSTFYLRQIFPYAEHWTPSVEYFRGLSLEPSRFPQYIIMFLLGIVCYRYNIISSISKKKGMLCLFGGMVTMAFLFCYTGIFVRQYFNSRFFAMFESFFSITFVTGLIVLFREYGNKYNCISKWLASQSYGAYVLHFIPLIGICMLLDAVEISVYLKFLAASIVSVVGAYVLSWMLRLIPGVKNVL